MSCSSECVPLTASIPARVALPVEVTTGQFSGSVLSMTASTRSLFHLAGDEAGRMRALSMCVTFRAVGRMGQAVHPVPTRSVWSLLR